MNGHGQILWSTADPANGTDYGPVTVANGVVFAGSVNGTGPVFALDALSGDILWQATTNGTVYGGFAVSDGCAYIGSGYSVNSGGGKKTFTSGDSLFAFCVPTVPGICPTFPFACGLVRIVHVLWL